MNEQSKREVVITGIGTIAAPFNAAEMLGKKGLKYLSGTTRLALAAVQLAAKDAGLPEGFGAYSGVVAGTSYGHLNSCIDFYESAIKDGEAYVNPMEFPNIMMTMTAGQIAIRMGLKALNKTVSTGKTAGADALCYAKDLIETKQAEVLFAGAAEETVSQMFANDFNTGARQAESVFFVLEEKSHAIKRNAGIYGAFLGYGSCFCPASSGLELQASIHRAVSGAVQQAGRPALSLQYLLTAASNQQESEQEEAAVRAVMNQTNTFGPLLKDGILLPEKTGVTSMFQIRKGLEAAKNKECFICNSFASGENCTSMIFESVR